jgi:hypothetical protein
MSNFVREAIFVPSASQQYNVRHKLKESKGENLHPKGKRSGVLDLCLSKGEPWTRLHLVY